MNLKRFAPLSVKRPHTAPPGKAGRLFAFFDGFRPAGAFDFFCEAPFQVGETVLY